MADLSPAVVADDLRALADTLPLDQSTRDVLNRAAELVDLVDRQAAELEGLRPIAERARDFGERPGLASAVALDTARYILTGETT
jgi:hypothetical protein